MSVNFGEFITKNDINEKVYNGKGINEFNEKLRLQLQNLVFEIEKDDTEKLKKFFYTQEPLWKKIFLFLPAAIGYVLHFPLYYPAHLFIQNKATDHYDSIIVGFLFFTYPWYILLLTAVMFFVTKNIIVLFLIILIPFTALCFLYFNKK